MTTVSKPLPPFFATVQLRATQDSAEERTAEVIFYSGAPVYRMSLWDGPYEMQFDMAGQSPRLDRLNNGAPLIDNHAAERGIAAQLGVVEKAWIKNGEGHARVRFSKRADVEPIWQDVQDGVIRSVSMGTYVLSMKDITPKDAKLKRFLATSWEPFEISLVAVPADAGARVLQAADDAESRVCSITSADGAIKETKMSDKTDATSKVDDAQPDVPAPKIETLAAPVDGRTEDREIEDAIAEDDARAKRIRELCTHYGLDDLFAQRHIKLGSSVKTVIAEGRKKRAEEAPKIDGRISVDADWDSVASRGERFAEALAYRAFKARPNAPGAEGYTLSEAARPSVKMSIAEVAFEVMHQLGMTRGRALDPIRQPYEVIKLAMGTTDFPGILANVLNKTLMPAYQAATPSFRRIAQQRQFNDYRAHKFVRLGDFPLTLQIGESGEITQGAMGEGNESVTALKYGRILNLLWEALVNDDLGAFGDFGGAVARRITDRENALFYAICIAAGSGLGPNLADGVAVYNAAHGSNIGSSGAMSNALLGEAFGKLASMTSIDGLKLNVPPRFVLTSATSYITARTFLSPIYAAQASTVNPFIGMLEPIYDANITGTRFYVLADPGTLPQYIHGTVGGNGPRFDVRQGWEIEGVQVKVVHDFGCGAIDYRGGITYAGA